MITIFLSDFFRFDAIDSLYKTTIGPDSELEIHPLHVTHLLQIHTVPAPAPLIAWSPKWLLLKTFYLQGFLLSCPSDISIPHFISLLSTIFFQIFFVPPSEAEFEINKHTAY
jgi:hypothetical protein